MTLLDRGLAARVKALLLDVDGVLTDGSVEFDSEGRTAARFDIKDGAGLVRLHRTGCLIGVVSGRRAPESEIRLRSLGIEEIHLAVEDKGAAVRGILDRHGVHRKEACFVGDDLPDLAAFAEVGFPVAVADAVKTVRDAASYVTSKRGGHGAVREVCDLLLSARSD